MLLSRLPLSPSNLVSRLRWPLQMPDFDPNFNLLCLLFLFCRLYFDSFGIGTNFACFILFYGSGHSWVPFDKLNMF
jgi:hypothetical protein